MTAGQHVPRRDVGGPKATFGEEKGGLWPETSARRRRRSSAQRAENTGKLGGVTGGGHGWRSGAREKCADVCAHQADPALAPLGG
jgi:hypothetical protein